MMYPVSPHFLYIPHFLLQANILKLYMRVHLFSANNDFTGSPWMLPLTAATQHIISSLPVHGLCGVLFLEMACSEHVYQPDRRTADSAVCVMFTF